MGVVIFNDKNCTGMKLRDRKVLLVSYKSVKINRGTYLARIKNSQGEITKTISTIIKRKRGAVGAGVQQTFSMCHLHETGKQKYKCTSYMCK